MTLQPISIAAAAYDSLTAAEFGGNYIAMTLKPFRWSITGGQEVFGDIVQPQGNGLLPPFYRLGLWLNMRMSAGGHVSAKGTIAFGYATPAAWPTKLQSRKLLMSAHGQVAGGQGDITTTIGRMTSAAVGRVSADGTIAMTLQKATTAVNAETQHISQINMLLSRLAMSASGEVSPSGTIAMKLRSVLMSSAGYQSPEFGTIAMTISKLNNFPGYAGTLHAEQIMTGTIETVLPTGPQIYIRGIDIQEGLIQMALPGPLTMSAAGWAEAEGSIAMQLHPLYMSAGAAEAPIGTITTVLGPFTQALAGDQWVRGTIASTLFNIQSGAAGTVTATGGSSDMDDMVPQGRITLTTATPFLTSDVTGAATVYYTPAIGVKIPIWGGSSFTATTFTEISQALSDATVSPAAAAANSVYDLFVWDKGGTLTLSRGPAWSTATTRGVGAGTTELNFVDGLWVNKNAITNGPGAGAGTYVGTIATDASTALNMMFAPAAVSGGSSNRLDVWNMYNRRRIVSKNVDLVAYFTDTAAVDVWQTWHNSAGNEITFVCGMPEDAITAHLSGKGEDSIDSALWSIGIGLDGTTCLDGAECANGDEAANHWGGAHTSVSLGPQLGRHFLVPLCITHTATLTLFAYATPNGGSLNWSRQAFIVALEM